MTKYLQEIACKNTHYWCTYHEGEFCSLSPSRNVMHKDCKVVVMEKPEVTATRKPSVKKILDNPSERERLMVDVIIATQAREGITTTREQALAAYRATRKDKS